MRDVIIKVILWRAVSIVITMILILCMTGDVRQATWFTLILHTILTVTHYIFENIWNRIKNVSNESRQ